MATSRAIKPKRDDTILSNWESQPERAPSIEREDRPTVARILAMIGAFLLVLGTLAMLAPNWQRATIIAPGFGFFFATLGLMLILFHAFAERDLQFRRLYAFGGLALLAVGVILRLTSMKSFSDWGLKTDRAMSWPTLLSGAEVFFFAALPALLIGLVILIAVIRNETDVYFRTLLMNIVGGLGALMIAAGILFGLRDSNHQFLPGEGGALLVFGLLYVSAYIAAQEANSERAYRAALALGAAGLLGATGGIIRSSMPESTFLVPSGLVLIGMSLIYLTVSLGICVDWPIIVLTRRDLAAYFFSPVAYLVLIGQLICAAGTFLVFAAGIQRGGVDGVVFRYMFNLFPVIVQTVLVPALTMRLMSEEKRSGTLEVLLTAPVNEISIVTGKFLACWIFYMMLWLPYWIFLISLRYMGHEEFDYRPVLSFTIALGSTSAGFVAMGLFFSALTSNQIIAAVFTFVGMLAHLAVYLLGDITQTGGAVAEVLSHINYFDFWFDSLHGSLAPRYVAFHLSVGVFFLFATIKLLESRKWK